MERQKGELLLSWQKKPVGVYFGDYKIYSFDSFEIVDCSERPKAFKVLFYAESLSGADLRGAYLEGAYLEGANLSNIKYDESTVWPEG